MAKVCGEWQTWAGGECPVRKTAKVEIKTRRGEIMGGQARDFRWSRISTFPTDTDIVLYRAV